MTTEEAIEKIKKQISSIMPQSVAYRDGHIKALRMAIQALGKQTPRKAIQSQSFVESYDAPIYYKWHCPECSYEVGTTRDSLAQLRATNGFCSCCGQAIDWSDSNDER